MPIAEIIAGCSIVELVGYAASVIVAVSLMMDSILKLRWFNLAGALLFLVYGAVIGALPIVLVNAIITAVDIYYLVRIYRSREFYRILLADSRSLYTNYFLEFYRDDIVKLFPKFSFTPDRNTIALYLLRNVLPAGMILGERRKDNVFFIQLDYVIPRYRDMKLGKYLYYDKLDFFRDAGFERLHIHSHTKEQERYLTMMGFRFVHNTHNGRLYAKDID